CCPVLTVAPGRRNGCCATAGAMPRGVHHTTTIPKPNRCMRCLPSVGACAWGVAMPAYGLQAHSTVSLLLLRNFYATMRARRWHREERARRGRSDHVSRWLEGMLPRCAPVFEHDNMSSCRTDVQTHLVLLQVRDHVLPYATRLHASHLSNGSLTLVKVYWYSFCS